jgi:hypothetical protein
MSVSDPLPPRPDLTIMVGDREIKMTYGLEMDIRRMLPDPATALVMIRDDMYTQDYIIRRVLTDKKKIITDPAELIDMDMVEIDSDQIEAILSWATEHALYFFIKRTLVMAQLGVQYNQALPKLSTDGSENSASTTPSAGPSE